MGETNEFTQLFDTRDEVHWTKEECSTLLKAFKHYGKDWNQIKRCFIGKPVWNIKLKLWYLLRGYNKKKVDPESLALFNNKMVNVPKWTK